MTNNDLQDDRERAARLQLRGLVVHWHEADQAGWARTLLDWEENERARRSLERRLKDARIGRFKPLVDFEWSFPTRCDRQAIEALIRNKIQAVIDTIVCGVHAPLIFQLQRLDSFTWRAGCELTDEYLTSSL